MWGTTNGGRGHRIAPAPGRPGSLDGDSDCESQSRQLALSGPKPAIRSQRSQGPKQRKKIGPVKITFPSQMPHHGRTVGPRITAEPLPGRVNAGQERFTMREIDVCSPETPEADPAFGRPGLDGGRGPGRLRSGRIG